MSLIKVLPVNEKLLKESLKSSFADIEDSFQHSIAIKGKCDCIITRNKRDYKNSRLPVYSPKEFMELQT